MIGFQVTIGVQRSVSRPFVFRSFRCSALVRKRNCRPTTHRTYAVLVRIRKKPSGLITMILSEWKKIVISNHCSFAALAHHLITFLSSSRRGTFLCIPLQSTLGDDLESVVHSTQINLMTNYTHSVCQTHTQTYPTLYNFRSIVIIILGRLVRPLQSDVSLHPFSKMFDNTSNGIITLSGDSKN